TEEGEDQHPQQHGAFVVAPCSGDLVEHRLQRMGVLPHIRYREIGQSVGRGKYGEGQRRQREAGYGNRPRACHHALIADARTHKRDGRLYQGERKGQNEREMSDFDHQSPSLSTQTPFSFSPSATSLGMYRSSCLASTLSAMNMPSAPKLPSVITPCPSRKRSGRTPL